MIKEFKEFIAKGNVVDLSVAVVMGAAFGAVVKSFTDDILMQLIAAVGGEPDFSTLAITLGDKDPVTGLQPEIRYGAFLNTIVSLVIVGFAMFLVVKAVNRLQNLRKAAADEAAPPGPSEVELLTEIRDALVAGRA